MLVQDNRKMFSNVFNNLTNVEAKVTIIQKDLVTIKTFVTEARKMTEHIDIMTIEELSNKHKLDLPFETLHSFMAFDKKIVNELYEDLVSKFIFLMLIKV